jgi:hypothetical protein
VQLDARPRRGATINSHPVLAVVLDVLVLTRRLLLLLLLPGVVTAVEAAGGRSKPTVVAGIVTGDAADHRTLQTAFGFGGRRRHKRERRDGKNGGDGFQGGDPVSSVEWTYDDWTSNINREATDTFHCTSLLVIRGLDPRIHRFAKESHAKDGLPGQARQ